MKISILILILIIKETKERELRCRRGETRKFFGKIYVYHPYKQDYVVLTSAYLRAFHMF
jgi:hypothetical protein